MASSSIPLHFDTVRNPLLQNNSFLFRKAPSILHHSFRSGNYTVITPSAKFNLYEMMGGRGLCNGEQGLRMELEKSAIRETESLPHNQDAVSVETTLLSPSNPVDELSFDKELMGLTGGFPGGEKGLQSFIEKNPPPIKKSGGGEEPSGDLLQDSKPKPPELPSLMPGMIVNVKNPENPFYLYSGIVQRVTDGNAGVLFEGDDWEKLLTFNLHELERRETGPHMVDPTSAIHESFVDTKSE
ncbi:NAD(P)H-quinone oxidoreductase subunit S, chloroplastic [Phalaenopsis equestris]|uniref:NAD(P)H-quinone oxidoreductase subunit S, chloroplastic n=1 Tax=Phalaenopsis equestris TaxID=78828 RepID=UPI0009E6282D|nr:NAD(P)H-quinone oxidoreductase subunit S, chloroplastic [Phalaenopsis equestris]